MFYRLSEGATREIDAENRTVALSFSSELPVDRYFGEEILDHNPESVDLSFLGGGSAPLLKDHDRYSQTGVITEARIGTDRKGRAVVRFGKSDLAEQEFGDVVDGIRQNVSVGYQIKRMVLDEASEDKEVYRVVEWLPLEISLVSIPADPTVGIGRMDSEKREFETIVEVPADFPVKDLNINAVPAERAITMEPNDDKKKPAVDIDAVKKAIAAKEKSRAADIIAIGETHGFRDEAIKAIAEDKTVTQFKDFVLDELKKRGLKPVDKPDPNIGLTEKEADNFSFVRLIRSLADPGDNAMRQAAGFEYEAIAAAAKQYDVSPRGVMIPYDVLARDINTTDDSALVATNLLAGSFIDVLRNRIMLREAGAFVLDGLVGNVAIPKKTGAASVYWVAEGVAPTESEAAFGQVTLTPKTCGTWTDVTRTMLLQSTPGIEMLVRADLAGSVAVGIDAAGLHGTGTANQPTGLAATAGIGAVVGGVNGLAPDESHIVDLETAVAIDNADIGALAYMTNAKVRGALKKTDIGTDTGLRVWDRVSPDTPLNGYSAHVTNQVASDLDKGTSVGVCSAIFFGNWNDLIIGMWAGLDLLVDPYSQSSSGNVRIRAFQTVDIGVRHAESFAAMLDALTA